MVLQKHDAEIAKAMGSEAVRMTEGMEAENRRLRAHVSEMTVALEVARDQREVDRQHILDAQVLIDQKSAGMAKLEKELAAGRLLVHASVAAERVSPRLVAWAGEPDQIGKGGSDGS